VFDSATAVQDSRVPGALFRDNCHRRASQPAIAPQAIAAGVSRNTQCRRTCPVVFAANGWQRPTASDSPRAILAVGGRRAESWEGLCSVHLVWACDRIDACVGPGLRHRFARAPVLPGKRSPPGKKASTGCTQACLALSGSRRYRILIHGQGHARAFCSRPKGWRLRRTGFPVKHPQRC
jgi:hypothetical protein